MHEVQGKEKMGIPLAGLGVLVIFLMVATDVHESIGFDLLWER